MEIENIGSRSNKRPSRAQAAYGCLNYHFFFTPNALFSWGLVVSYNLVEYACVSLLVTFYTNKSEREKHLAGAAVFLCLQEGLASLAAIILARITDDRVGRRFYAIVVSTASYITGILLLWLYAQHEPQAMNVPLFLVVSVLFAVGKSGADPLLTSFLVHNLSQSYKGTSQSKDATKTTEICRKLWMHSAWIVGATIAIFGFLGVKWLQVFKISAIVMVASGLLFLFGCNNCTRPIDVVDREYAIQVSETSQIGEKSCGAKPVRYLKWLLMLSCIAYSLVLGTGNIFFQEQSTKMKSLTINKEEVRFSLFIVMKTFVNEITILILGLCRGNEKQGFLLVRIGTGMACATICCIIAWKVEVQRKKVATDTMSVLWMCPHYVLLGLVEGLAQSGLEKLLEDDDDDKAKSLRNCGKFSKDMVSCIGKLFGIPCILIVRRWFKNFDKDQSHLDRYYLMLAVLCCGFLCIYLCIAMLYLKLVSEDVEEGGSHSTTRVHEDST